MSRPASDPFKSRHIPPLPACPTDVQPGSKAKIEIMRGRLERGEALFHPRDRSIRPTPAYQVR